MSNERNKTAPLTPNNIREFGKDLEFVWGDYCDEPIIAQASEVSRSLLALADLIESSYPQGVFHDEQA